MTPTPPPDDIGPDLDEIDALLMQCLESGSGAEFERMCTQRADLAGELRRRYRLLDAYGFLQPEPAPVSMPERIGGFRILRRVGIGGMGVVYLAEQEAVGRRVALKLLRPERLESPNARLRFQRECTTLASLDHPGICPVYDVGEIDGQPYLAMRYLEGASLAAHLERLRATAGRADASTGTGTSSAGERARIDRVVAWFEKIARAAHAAHRVGLVHRDLKPANIMITSDEEPVILDFGLARDERTESGLTLTDDVVGTPAYLPPERIDGHDADVRSDIYSLGVTLYETLTLQRPFDGASRAALYRQILSGDHARATEVNRSVSRDLQVVTATAMERDPACRYATAHELAEDLRRVRQFEPIRARPAPVHLRLRRWTQRNPALAILVVALVVGLATTLFLLQRIRDEARTSRAILAGFNPLLELGNPNPIHASELRTALGPGSTYVEVVRSWNRMLEARAFASPAVEAAIRQRVGVCLSYAGAWLEALDNLERAHALFQGLGDEEAAAVCEAQTAWCLIGLGHICTGRRRAEAASRVLARFRGPLDPDYVWARLAVLHAYQDHLGPEVLAANLREVEELRRRLHAAPEAEFPAFLADVIGATVLSQAGELKRADAVLGAALTACEQQAGVNNLSRVLIRWQWVHVAYQVDGNADRALRLHRESIETLERIVGSTESDWLVLLRHPLTWLPLDPAGTAAALRHLRERARLTEKRFGSANPRTIRSAINLVRFFLRQPVPTDREVAKEATDDLVRLARRLVEMAPRAGDTMLQMVQLAALLRELGHTGPARDLARSVATGAAPEDVDQAAAVARAAALLAQLDR